MVEMVENWKDTMLVSRLIQDWIRKNREKEREARKIKGRQKRWQIRTEIKGRGGGGGLGRGKCRRRRKVEKSVLIKEQPLSRRAWPLFDGRKRFAKITSN